MLNLVQTNLARRIWRACKTFNLPPNDPRIRELSVWDLDFIEYSAIADDPKKLSRLKNYFYDPEYDDWVAEFEAEMDENNKEKENPFDFSEYEVHDEEDSPAEMSYIDENKSDDKNIRQSTEEQNLTEISQQDEEFVRVVSDEVGIPNINDWEEV